MRMQKWLNALVKVVGCARAAAPVQLRLIFDSLTVSIRIFTFGAFALIGKASEDIVFAKSAVFVVLSVLEIIALAFYDVVWQVGSLFSEL